MNKLKIKSMSSEKTNVSNKGIGLCGLIFLVFLVFKLAGMGHVADWSWWWVTAPLWMPAGLALVVLLIWIIGFCIVILTKKKRTNREFKRKFGR